jgi:hypothetical protein
MRPWWLYLGLAVLGWTISGSLHQDISGSPQQDSSDRLQQDSSDRLIQRIREDDHFLQNASVSFESRRSVSLLEESWEDERYRTTASFWLRLYDNESGKSLTAPLHLYTRTSPKHRHPTPPDGPFLTSNGAYALVGCYFPRQELRVLDCQTGKLLETTIPVPSVGSGNWSAGQNGLVCYQTGAGFVIVDPAEGRVIKSYQHPQPNLKVSCVKMDPSGTTVAVATPEGLLIGSTRGTDLPKAVFAGPAQEPSFTKKGQEVVFLSGGKVMQFDLSRRRLIGGPIGERYDRLRASLDGRTALASQYGQVDVIELPSGRLRSSRQRIVSAAGAELLSSAGDRVLAAERADKDAVLLVWETRKGRELYSLRREGYLRSPLGLSADGRQGANCDSSGINLWRL